MRAKRLPSGLTHRQWQVLWAIALGTKRSDYRAPPYSLGYKVVLGREDVSTIVGYLWAGEFIYKPGRELRLTPQGKKALDRSWSDTSD